MVINELCLVGSVLLDIEDVELHKIAETIADNMAISDQITAEERDRIVNIVMLRHRHLNDKKGGLKRQKTFMSLSRLFSHTSDPGSSVVHSKTVNNINDVEGRPFINGCAFVSAMGV